MVKAEDLKGRCPSSCSGTAAATYGCSDGSIDAEKQIHQLLKHYDLNNVVEYLKTMSKNPAGLEKIKIYFPKGPRAFKIIK